MRVPFCRSPWWSALCFLLLIVSSGCDSRDPGSPEAVADAFVDAYFRQADQKKAIKFTAFSARALLEKEIQDVSEVRKTGYTVSDAGLSVEPRRESRSMRGERVRFDYRLQFRGRMGQAEKKADVELSRVHGEWKVVRLGVSR